MNGAFLEALELPLLAQGARRYGRAHGPLCWKATPASRVEDGKVRVAVLAVCLCCGVAASLHDAMNNEVYSINAGHALFAK